MIDKILSNIQNCMGCHGCANICPKKCIDMKPDVEGFLYPTVDYCICIKCNKCVKVCPIINKVDLDINPIAYACINKDEEIRLDSSSGGVFTLIAEKVIDKGGVVFGAAFNDEFEVEHNFIETKDQLGIFRGSKYVQSKIGITYEQAKMYLNSGREVLFSGTPCQIAGLKSFLGKYYSNLITLDIICHGVPSPDVWQKYIKFRENQSGSSIEKIAFRRKESSWKRFSVSFKFSNNTEYRQNLTKDLYMRVYLKDICLRPSCYKCYFKTLNRQSDITLADFWGIQYILPEMDDDKGTSLILVNSKKGKLMFNDISERMIFKEVDIFQAIKFNLPAVKSVKPNKNRDEFFLHLNRLPFDKLVKRYCTDKISINLLIKKVITVIKRIVSKSIIL